MNGAFAPAAAARSVGDARHVIAGGPSDRAGGIEIAANDAGDVGAETPTRNVRRRCERVQLRRRIEPAGQNRIEIAGGHAEQRRHRGRRPEPEIDGTGRARLPDHACFETVREGAAETVWDSNGTSSGAIGALADSSAARRTPASLPRTNGGAFSASIPRHPRGRAPEPDQRGTRQRRRKRVVDRLQAAGDVVVNAARPFTLGILPRVRDRPRDVAAHRRAFGRRQRDHVPSFRVQIGDLPLDDARAECAMRAPDDVSVARHRFEQAVEANEIEHAVRVRGNERMGDDGLVQGGRNLSIRSAPATGRNASGGTFPSGVDRAPGSSRSMITGA